MDSSMILLEKCDFMGFPITNHIHHPHHSTSRNTEIEHDVSTSVQWPEHGYPPVSSNMGCWKMDHLEVILLLQPLFRIRFGDFPDSHVWLPELIWLVLSTPLKNITVGMIIPNMWKNVPHVPTPAFSCFGSSASLAVSATDESSGCASGRFSLIHMVQPVSHELWLMILAQFNYILFMYIYTFQQFITCKTCQQLVWSHGKLCWSIIDCRTSASPNTCRKSHFPLCFVFILFLRLLYIIPTHTVRFLHMSYELYEQCGLNPKLSNSKIGVCVFFTTIEFERMTYHVANIP